MQDRKTALMSGLIAVTAWLLLVAAVGCEESVETEGYTLEQTMEGDIIESRRVTIAVTNDGIQMPASLEADRYALFVQNRTSGPIIVSLAGPQRTTDQDGNPAVDAIMTRAIAVGEGVTIQQRLSQGQWEITANPPTGGERFNRTLRVEPISAAE